MEKNKKDHYSIRDIVSQINFFLIYLKKKWWVMLLTLIAGSGLGTIVYFIQKPRFEADCTFILEEKSSGGGGLAGLASQFGFDFGSLTSGGSIFQGDNILDILKSKKIIHKVLLSKMDKNERNQTSTLADRFLDFSGWKKKWSTNAALKDINYSEYSDQKNLPEIQDSVLDLIHEFLLKNSLSTERLNKKGSIIKVSVTTPDKLFSRLMTERVVDEAAKLYLEIKTGTSQANIAQMQRRSDSLLYLLNRKTYSVAASQPLDINPGVKAAVVPVEIASRDKVVLSTLYAEVTKNLEASKLLLSQQTPVIQILDSPGNMLRNSRTSLLFLVLVFSLGAAFICLFGILVRYYFSTFQYQE